MNPMAESSYLNLVKHYFLHTDIPPAEIFLPAAHLSQAYHDACGKKAALMPQWNALLDALGEMPELGRIRDMYYDQPHLFKAVMSFSEDHRQGIILHISMLGELIGFIFCDFNSEAVKGCIQVNDSSISHRHESYYPFSERQEVVKQLILKKVAEFFSTTAEFPWDQAGIKVERVFTWDRQLIRADLFQVLFTHNIHGLI